MALTITHTTAADGTFSASGATNWNANHTLAGSIALSEITAATGAVTIASGNNTGIVWNWANTADSTICHTLGETSAATGGTSTSGVPNQVLLKINTVAASTQSPLSVYSRAAHVFSVSPSAAQILGASGVIGNPTYGFAASVNTGMYLNASSDIAFATGGSQFARIQSNNAVGLITASNSSTDFPSTTILRSTINATQVGNSTIANFRGTVHGANDPLSVFGSLRSRGTAASPTVITSGDVLSVISSYGYLGATNTYVEATRVTHASVGTISDATNGIGGIIKFSTRKQGVDTAVAERFRVDDAGHLVSIAGTANTPTITAGGGTSPTISGTDNAFTVTIGTGGVASSVEVTFATAYANAPITSAQSDTDILALKSTPLTTKVTITASTPFTAGSNIDCICIGRA